MLKNKIEIRKIEYGSDDYDQSLYLRHEVLRRPWGRSIAEDDLDHEREEFLLGAFDGNILIGMGSLVMTDDDIAQVRYMAIDESYRREGIGSQILSSLEDHAREEGKLKLILNAREKAIPFYEGHNYHLTGELKIPPFIPIPHAMMEKNL